MALTVIRQLAESRINPGGFDSTRNQNIEDSGSLTKMTGEKENRVLDLLTRFSRLSKDVRTLGYIKRFVKNCRTHPRLDVQAAVPNVADATTATGDIDTRESIGPRLVLRTEESDDAREGYASKSAVAKGGSVGTESKRKYSMKIHKEIGEGIGTGADICAMVGIGNGKGLTSANAFLFDASKSTGTKPDDETSVGTELDTSANSVRSSDSHSGKGTGREIGGKGTGLDFSCFAEAGLQVWQQLLIARRQQFHRAEFQGAKTTTTKLTTLNGNLVKFNQGNDGDSEELQT